MSNETKTLYACVHAGEFPAQALLRLRIDLQGEAVAVMDGEPPQEFVCAMNAHALRRGVARGMTRLDAEAMTGLRLLARSVESEAAARMVVLERAAKFSPRIEEVSEGTACAFVLDIAGTERLFGPPEKLAERLRADLAAAGFRASIAVSANFETARMKAAASRGITVIPEGAEAVALARLPLSALPLEGDHREKFAIWGIRTLGELAALPEVELIARLGQRARGWREAAWGMLPHLFRPIEAEFVLKEFFAFDDAVEEMDSLLFVGARMIDALVERAADRALALARVTVRMKLDGGATHELALRPAIPSADRKFLLKLLQLEIAAHPPQAAVMNFELHAEAAQSSLVQLGLFAPQTPEPSRLDVTLARLKAIVGEDRVGSAVLEDEHRPGSFRMEEFHVDAKAEAREVQGQRMGLRRMRPAVPVRVWMRGAEPAAFATVEERFEVTAAYGPWRTSGSWWSMGEWDVEEWDVLGRRRDGASVACLLVRDGARGEWRLEAMYD
ncbi:MAG TPA: DNA polymerase Y family protein [Terracidiphilus sp.]|jgi:protein ImuB|nr:DNA polymerase Y family protein [Terracidiphilus sp.]